jgi:hypothetical protein
MKMTFDRISFKNSCHWYELLKVLDSTLSRDLGEETIDSDVPDKTVGYVAMFMNIVNFTFDADTLIVSSSYIICRIYATRLVFMSFAILRYLTGIFISPMDKNFLSVIGDLDRSLYFAPYEYYRQCCISTTSGLSAIEIFRILWSLIEYNHLCPIKSDCRH